MAVFTSATVRPARIGPIPYSVTVMAWVGDVSAGAGFCVDGAGVLGGERVSTDVVTVDDEVTADEVSAGASFLTAHPATINTNEIEVSSERGIVCFSLRSSHGERCCYCKDDTRVSAE